MVKQSSPLQDSLRIAKVPGPCKARFGLVSCKHALVSGIKAYQCLSRAFHFRNCRFYPSCSQYAIDAIERFGIIRGASKAMARILRCSPFSDGGYDPVR